MTKTEQLQRDISKLRQCIEIIGGLKSPYINASKMVQAIENEISELEGRIGRQTDIFSMLQEVEHEN